MRNVGNGKLRNSVDIEYIRIAVRRCDRDTLMRRAFMRALGMDESDCQTTRIGRQREDAYSDVLECFKNKESAMDGRSL